jgi:hypothetical protein
MHFEKQSTLTISKKIDHALRYKVKIETVYTVRNQAIKAIVVVEY